MVYETKPFLVYTCQYSNMEQRNPCYLQICDNRRGLRSSRGAVGLKETASSDMCGTGIYNSLVCDLLATFSGTCKSIGEEMFGRMIVPPPTEDRTEFVEAG